MRELDEEPDSCKNGKLLAGPRPQDPRPAIPTIRTSVAPSGRADRDQRRPPWTSPSSRATAGGDLRSRGWAQAFGGRAVGYASASYLFNPQEAEPHRPRGHRPEHAVLSIADQYSRASGVASSFRWATASLGAAWRASLERLIGGDKGFRRRTVSVEPGLTFRRGHSAVTSACPSRSIATGRGATRTRSTAGTAMPLRRLPGDRRVLALF